MPLDSEPIASVRAPDAIGSVFVDLISKINYKIAIFLFILFVLISSDVFVSRVLGHIPNATKGASSSNYGTFIQSMFLAVGYIIMDILVRNEVI